MEAALHGYTYKVYVTPPTHKADLPGIVEAQNQLIDKCIHEGWDYLWLVQADVQVPTDSFVKLLGLGVDVAQGYVCGHDDKNRLVCGYLDENKKVWYLPRYVVKNQVLSGWVFAGMSCTLIKRRVLEAGIRFRLEPGVGEDILFMYDVQSKGFVARVHGGVYCGHLPEWPLTTYLMEQCLCNHVAAKLPSGVVIEFDSEKGTVSEVRRNNEFKVLDVGCGHQPKGEVNVDLHVKATAHRAADQRVNDDVALNVRGIPNFVRADACHLPFCEGAFDSVFSNHLIEHVEEPELMLAEAVRVARRRIELHCPNGEHPSSHSESKPLHLHRFHPSWFENQLRQLGLSYEVHYGYSQGEPWEIVVEAEKNG